MNPQQQPYQPGQVIQPQQPAQQPQPLDFTAPSQPQQPTPQAPAAPAFDPNAFKQEILDGVKNVISGAQPQPGQQQAQPQPQQPTNNEPQYFTKQYDDWGVLEQDTKKLVADVVKEHITQITQEQEQSKQAADVQEQQNQQIIDNTLNELRGAGFLPPVANKFDANDAGRQAEQELIGYAVYLGTADLVKAAQELKFKHDVGMRYDYQTKQFVQTGAQQPTGPSMFGNLPVTPDAQQPQMPVPPTQAPMQPMYPQQYGPQNPYMARPQYPAGFNAPVSTGGGYMGVGMQGQVPNATTLRHNSYDNLIEMFNRTQ